MVVKTIILLHPVKTNIICCICGKNKWAKSLSMQKLKDKGFLSECKNLLKRPNFSFAFG